MGYQVSRLEMSKVSSSDNAVILSIDLMHTCRVYLSIGAYPFIYRYFLY